MKITYTNRKINYFELSPTYLNNNEINNFIDIFKMLRSFQDEKSPNRFYTGSDKMLYMSDIKFDNEQQQIRGKFLNIRMDVFPELMDTQSDIIRDIEAAESEGIIEPSHFILSYKNESMILSFEFNQYGPRVSDMSAFLTNKVQDLNIFEKIEYNALCRDDLHQYKKRIKHISLVTAKVHKDNLKRINELDTELFDAFETAAKVSEAEYVTMNLSYDFRDFKSSMNMRDKIMKIIEKFIGDKSTSTIFSTLKVKAEDQARNNRIKEFDLLNIWVKSEIRVENKPKSRAIVSADIFQKMQEELNKEFNR